MTCILGMVDEHGAGWVGADSYQDNGVVKSTIKGKAWRHMDGRGRYALIGTSGRAAFRPIVKAAFSLPFSLDPETYIMTEFPRALRLMCEEQKFVDIDNGLVSLPDNDLMIVYSGKIYYMDSYFYIRETSRKYHAIGAGMVAAMGAMFVMGAGSSPDERLQLALLAAENLSAYVSSPFEILRDQDE